jgi:hypothetical protein
MGIPARVLHPTSHDNDPLRPVAGARQMPSRSAAAQRRAMQAAMANAVRAMHSPGGGRRDAGSGPGRGS